MPALDHGLALLDLLGEVFEELLDHLAQHRRQVSLHGLQELREMDLELMRTDRQYPPKLGQQAPYLIAGRRARARHAPRVLGAPIAPNEANRRTQRCALPHASMATTHGAIWAKNSATFARVRRFFSTACPAQSTQWT
jgi:hypothetical protein